MKSIRRSGGLSENPHSDWPIPGGKRLFDPADNRSIRVVVPEDTEAEVTAPSYAAPLEQTKRLASQR